MVEKMRGVLKQPVILWACVILGILLGIGAGTGVVSVYMRNNPPVQVLTSYFIWPEIRQGDFIYLYVKVTGTTNRQCQGGVVREYIQDIVLPLHETSGGTRSVPVILRDDAAAPIYDINRHEYVVKFSSVIEGVPIPPGEYRFRGETSYFCGWFAKGSYLAEQSPAGDVLTLNILPR